MLIIIGVFHGVAGVARANPGLMEFHQPVKEVKSAGKIFIECPYGFA